MISTGLCCINLILLIMCDCSGPVVEGKIPVRPSVCSSSRVTRGRDVDYVAILTTSVFLACMAYMLTHFLCLWFSANMMFAGCNCLAE